MRAGSFVIHMILSISCGLLLVACAKQDQAVADKQPPIVNAEQVQEFNPVTSAESHYSGAIQPSRQMDVAFKASGYVQSIGKIRGAEGVRLLQAGDAVRKGTVLATVRESDYRAKINEQATAVNEIRVSQQRGLAALAEAEASLDAAKVNYERTSRLFASDSVTKPEYDTASNNFELAKIRVQEAKAAVNSSKATEMHGRAGLAEANLALQDCVLRAPFDGVILKRLVEEGSLAAQGTVAYTIADDNNVKVTFGVPDVEIKNLAPSQSITVHAAAVPSRDFIGKITEISPDADARSRVFNVEVSLPNANRQLRIGMVASVVTTPQGALGSKYLTVPLKAVVRSSSNPGGYAVFVVSHMNDKYTAEERQVRLGEATGHLIQVESGLKLGESVVTDGSTRVAQGQEIKIADGTM